MMTISVTIIVNWNDVSDASMSLYDLVKPVLFACPLFREFRDLGNLAKITGR